MSKHTEGKINACGGVMNPNSDNPTCWLWSETPPGMQSGKVIAQKVSLPDARRLVQCWNEHDDLVKERDELVVALRNLRQGIHEDFHGTYITEEADEILAKYQEKP